MAKQDENAAPRDVGERKEREQVGDRVRAGVEIAAVGGLLATNAPALAVGGVAVGAAFAEAGYRRGRQIEASHQEIDAEHRKKLEDAGLSGPKKKIAGGWKYFGWGLGRLLGNQDIGRLIGREVTSHIHDDAEAYQLVEIAGRAANMDPDIAYQLNYEILNNSELADMPVEAIAQAAFMVDARAQRIAGDIELKQPERARLVDNRVEAYKKFAVERDRLNAPTNPQSAENQRRIQERSSYEDVSQEIDAVRELFAKDEQDLSPGERADKTRFLTEAKKTMPEKSFLARVGIRKREIEMYDQRVNAEAVYLATIDHLNGDHDQREADFLNNSPESILQQSVDVNSRIYTYEAQYQAMLAQQPPATPQEIAQFRVAFLQTVSPKYWETALHDAEEEFKEQQELHYEQIMVEKQGVDVERKVNRLADPRTDFSIPPNATPQQTQQLQQERSIRDNAKVAVGPEFATAWDRQFGNGSGSHGTKELLNKLATGNNAEVLNWIQTQRGSLDAINTSMASVQAEYDAARKQKGSRGQDIVVSDSELRAQRADFAAFIDNRDRLNTLKAVEASLQNGDARDALKYLRVMEAEDDKIIAEGQGAFRNYVRDSVQNEQENIVALSEQDLASRIGGEYEEAYKRLVQRRALKDQMPRVIQVALEDNPPGALDAWFTDPNNNIDGMSGKYVDILKAMSHNDVLISQDRAVDYATRAKKWRDGDDPVVLEYKQRAEEMRQRLVADKDGGEIKNVKYNIEELQRDADEKFDAKSTQSEKEYNAARRQHKNFEHEIVELGAELRMTRQLVDSSMESLRRIYGSEVVDRMEAARSDLARHAAEQARYQKLVERAMAGEEISPEQRAQVERFIRDSRHKAQFEAELAQEEAVAERRHYVESMADSLGLTGLDERAIDTMVKQTKGMSFFEFLMTIFNEMFTAN